MFEPAPAAVKSADRVIDLFELLAHSSREMSHSEIAGRLDIPKSSLTQLLKNLMARGYVEASGSGRGYRLGTALLSLSRSAGQRRDLATEAQPFLVEVTRVLRESSALNQIKGDETEVAAAVLGPHRLVTHMRLGDTAPLHCTSGGKAILAHMPANVLLDYVRRVRFEPITPTTITNPAELKRQLASIRKGGIAYVHEEFTPGIVGIATPILDTDGVALGAMSVAIPAVRYDKSVQKTAEEVLLRQAGELQRHTLR